MGLMAGAGRIASEILASLGERLEPGLSTLQLDEFATAMMTERGVLPSFKGFRGYPSAICASLNDAVVHGIPSSELRLRDGDIVSIDLGVIYQGYHADTAATFPVGEVPEEAERLLSVAEKSLGLGIASAAAGRPLSDVSKAVQGYVEANGCSVIRALTGHGIGKSMHEEPPVPNFHDGNPGPTLKTGMALAIEPMVSLGDYGIVVGPDGWTVRTVDGSLSAHFEHTIIVQGARPRVLTRVPDRQGGPFAPTGELSGGEVSFPRMCSER